LGNISHLPNLCAFEKYEDIMAGKRTLKRQLNLMLARLVPVYFCSRVMLPQLPDQQPSGLFLSLGFSALASP